MENTTQETQATAPGIEQLIRDALERIDYGTIEITIHDSRIVQVQTSQKTRFHTK